MVLQEVVPETAKDEPAKSSCNRALLVFFVLAALSLLAMGWIVGAVSFDGSSYFFEIVEFQRLFQPVDRFSSAPFEYPTVIASAFTNSVSTLRHVFGVSYAFAPLSAILASWLVIRRRTPHLMVWPVLAIGVVAFPAIVFPVSESGIVAEWAWPLVFVTLVALDEIPSLVVGLIFSIFLLFLAANALVVFILIAAIAAVRAASQPAARTRMLLWAGVMLIFGFVRYFVLRGDFELGRHQPHFVAQRILESLKGPSFVSYLIAAGAAALLLLLLRFARGGASSWLTYMPAGLLIISGVFLVLYASNDKSWVSALVARDSTLLLEIPIVLGCVVDELAPRYSTTPELDRRNRSARGSMIVATGVVLVIAGGAFCGSWTNLTNNLTTRLQSVASYCVEPSLLQQQGTILEEIDFPDDFPTLVIDLQGKKPAHVPLSPANCQALESQGGLILGGFQAPARGGWFIFSANAPKRN
jgi:hypothetical protein